jgi:hypothetical protein
VAKSSSGGKVELFSAQTFFLSHLFLLPQITLIQPQYRNGLPIIGKQLSNQYILPFPFCI